MDSKMKAEILKGVILSRYKSIRFAVFADTDQKGHGEVLEAQQERQEESDGDP